MRLEMAAGQYLDFVGVVRDPHQLAALKGGAYTVEGPLLVGATLAGATLQVQTRLQRFGEPLGQAFQLRDDLRDGEPGAVTQRDVVNLVSQAKQALDASVLDPDAVAALSTLADLVASS
jgi:geranylgeranyl pyrophosphate synthase